VNEPEKSQEGAPDAQAIAAMREHREGEHRRAFDLARHVDYPGQKRKRAAMTYVPAFAGRLASFHCSLCERRFLLGQADYGERETQLRWLREHPSVADQIRRSEIPDELSGPAIQAYLDGEIGEGGFAGWLRHQQQRDARKRRPKDAQREDGCQRFLLEKRLQGYTVDRAIDSLLEMQGRDSEEWQALSGGTKTVAEATLRRYWRHIPKSVREATLPAADGSDSTPAEIKGRLHALLSPSNDLPREPGAMQSGRHAKRSPLPPPGALKERGGPGARHKR
jgi:hypothetical protein